MDTSSSLPVSSEIARTRPGRLRRLPPGQRARSDFPRFGTTIHRPPPEVPADYRLRVGGDIDGPFEVSLDELAAIGDHSITADFHCVTGWSALDLEWRGVPFAAFFDQVVGPHLDGRTITHVTFRGLDGVSEVAEIDDVMAPDVLLADALNGAPLDGDHGAPLRLVSPGQYGYMNVKHLSSIHVHTSAPRPRLTLADRLLRAHPRARVWHEERHGRLPAWTIRRLYRWTIRPILAWAARSDAGRS